MKAVPLAVAVFCSVVFGQMVTPEMRTAASDAYQKQDWKAAATAYEAIVKVEDKNAGANYRLMTHYVGGLVAGKMVLDSESTQNGQKTIARMTFSKLPNGDVRQHGENSTDGGKTWTTSFDFIYVRKK